MTGLSRNSATPSERASDRSGRTEQRTIGIPWVRGSPASSRSRSQPSCAGIKMSSVIASGRTSRQSRSAASPVLAWTTRYPWSRTKREKR